ncbi:uncharacterized protein FFFS_15905 [Fusarium fujikuroi]|nr:uncharacterized protein FFFS_15905 [Fusarium fujikuroi]
MARSDTTSKVEILNKELETNIQNCQLRETIEGHWLWTRCSQRTDIHHHLLPAGAPEQGIAVYERAANGRVKDPAKF